MSSSSAARVLDLLAAPEETSLEPAVSVARLPRSERTAPDVTTIHGAQAVAIIRAAGYIAAIESVSSDLAEGSVIEQDPAERERLEREKYRETAAAGVRLSAPRRVHPGRAFAFQGALAGGYIPPGGALVSLEILFAGEWREIALLRTNHRGAFAYHYTFAAIGPATYRFRAALPHTIGYPFASGASRSSFIHLTG